MSKNTPNNRPAEQASPAAEPVAEGSTPEPAAEGISAEPTALERDPVVAELKNEILYLRADFDNFRKRTEKRYREALEYATEPLLKDLLPVLDNLERAVAHAKEGGPSGFDALLEGLGHVVGQLQQVLAGHGVEDVVAHGEKFNPNVHESLAHVPGEEDNRVAEVYQKGYLLKGRLLRPAQVAISKVATPRDDG